MTDASAYDVEDGWTGDYEEQERGADKEQELGWIGDHVALGRGEQQRLAFRDDDGVLVMSGQ